MSNTFWSAIDQINTALSGSNLVATSASGQAAVRAIDGFTTGKYYWECTINTASSTDSGVGISSQVNFLGSLGSNASGAVIMYTGFPVYVNGSQYSPTTNIGTITAGSVIGIACDFGAKLIWFRLGATGSWNATSGSTNNPATGTGGVSFSGLSAPFAPVASIWTTSDKVTANFGDTTFAGSVPSGFTSGVPNTPFTPSFTTWNPADRSSIQLSGKNLIASEINFGAWIRAIDKQVTGKFYWEATLALAISSYIGFCSGVIVPTTSTAGLVVLSNSGGSIFVNGINTGVTLGGRAVNDVISVAADLTAAQIWYRVAPSGNWNGSSTANPATGIGGVSIVPVAGGGIAAYPLALFSGSSSVIANFGDSTFTGTVPSGFTSGFTPGATTPTNALVTQAAAEHWITTNAPAQVTQVAIEHWAPVLPPQLSITQIGAQPWVTTLHAPFSVTQIGAIAWIDTTKIGLFPAGIPSSTALGTINFYAIAYMQPTGIASEEALGTTKVVPILRPPGIPSAEMVGSPTLVAIARHGGMFFHGFP